MDSLQNRILPWLPPIVLPILKRLFKIGIRYENGFNTWDSAVAASEGYDGKEIVSKVFEASLLARDEGLHERDGFILDAPDFNPYTWIGIIQARIMVGNSRKMRIVDFGGSLGSTYRMMQDQLCRAKIDFEWVIIEQKHFVNLGKKHFETNELRFVDSFSSLTNQKIDVLIFNSVLEYLANPYEIITEAVSHSPYVVLIDRTPVNSQQIDTFSVQHVPKSIYRASYANRNFCENNLVRPFESSFSLLLKYESELQPDPLNTSMGFIFIQNND